MTNPPVTGWIYRVPVITELYTLHYVSQNRQGMNICASAFLSHIQPQRRQTEDPSASKRLFCLSHENDKCVGLHVWKVMCWQLHWKAHSKPSNHTFLNTAPLWAVKENKGISLCLSNKGWKKTSLLEFMPQQREKCSQISSVCACVEIQLFRCARWHFGTLSLIYLCADDKPLVYFMACVCCVMFEATLVHVLSPRCRSFMLQMNRQDDLSVTLLFGAGGALAGCM